MSAYEYFPRGECLLDHTKWCSAFSLRRSMELLGIGVEISGIGFQPVIRKTQAGSLCHFANPTFILAPVLGAAIFVVVACVPFFRFAIDQPELLALFLATFASEDLACVAAGLLVQKGAIAYLPAAVACFLGIYLGDLGIWLTGKFFGRRILDWSWVRRRTNSATLQSLGNWFDRYGWCVILGSRFLPGVRVPLYLAIGMFGKGNYVFPVASLVGVAIWAPTLIGISSWIGATLLDGFGSLRSWNGWVSLTFVALVVADRSHSRRRVFPGGSTKSSSAPRALSTFRTWEFWPAWAFYIPIAPWIAWLMLRYRSLTVWTAANPGIPHGGVIGESKFDILRQIPSPWRTSSELLPIDSIENRISRMQAIQGSSEFAYPIIMKPDVGQRGSGVKLVRSESEAREYLEAHPQAVIVQAYHPGPFEAGVFYVRLPNEQRGRIFSITEKIFPVLFGDGVSTIRELILIHPRYRHQAAVFFSRFSEQLDRVLEADEQFSLGQTGNHCQGTMFVDGERFRTPALEARFDAIAKQFDGFYFGRFDVRFGTTDGFRAGTDLSIVELNGVTSESTNLYDPKHTLFQAYSILARQWSLLFRVGHLNRLAGHRPTDAFTFIRLILAR